MIGRLQVDDRPPTLRGPGDLDRWPQLDADVCCLTHSDDDTLDLDLVG
ncbi:MAG: hypothetical protein ACI8S6_003215 [Myxococcota bacterium]